MVRHATQRVPRAVDFQNCTWARVVVATRALPGGVAWGRTLKIDAYASSRTLCEKQKQILRAAYTLNDWSFMGPQDCGAQDDTAVLLVRVLAASG